LPLMDALTALAWTSRIPVPTVFDYRGTVNTLSDAFICSQDVYPPLAFCAGVALLFSRERARRDGRLQRARRWGIGCGYVVLLLNAVQILFISALVLVGIAAVFQSMPLKYQPVATQLFVDLSTTYLRYGPYPGEASVTVLAAFSSIVMLLACVPLFDVLRRSGPKLPAAILLAPLALLALISLVQIARYYLRASSSHW